ncbi:MAG: UDP-N-acetylmuramate dehydrogenase [Treponema sp.]|jgi:UDP-N-acetylmuramate dehydrogenase|nr:UDP-N-acetylmuramate dehydrogenase [Treponema sp.]
MNSLRRFIERINTLAGAKIRGGQRLADIRYDEPMSAHTTFRVGGPADVWIQPLGEAFPVYTSLLLEAARREGVEVFILGGGANILAADRGIRGIVLDTGGWKGIDREGKAADGKRFPEPLLGKGERLVFKSGTPVDEALEAAASAGLGGLEFLAGMPGTVGGAVWMNARCYDKSVSDVLLATEILDEGLERVWLPFRGEDFAYKKSPFQARDVLILAACFALTALPEAEIRGEMAGCRRDRDAKGHYRFPSAGSVFKNNRAFGKSTGKIIDELGLKGFSRGGAAIAPWHGNIIINTGNATAADIRALTGDVAARVRAALGIELEPEILFIGEF